MRRGQARPGLDDVKSASGEIARAAIPAARLDRLLKGMDRRGLLTYYGEIRQVVLDDADHDRARRDMMPRGGSATPPVAWGRAGGAGARSGRREAASGPACAAAGMPRRCVHTEAVARVPAGRRAARRNPAPHACDRTRLAGLKTPLSAGKAATTGVEPAWRLVCQVPPWLQHGGLPMPNVAVFLEKGH